MYQSWSLHCQRLDNYFGFWRASTARTPHHSCRSPWPRLFCYLTSHQTNVKRYWNIHQEPCLRSRGLLRQTAPVWRRAVSLQRLGVFFIWLKQTSHYRYHSVPLRGGIPAERCLFGLWSVPALSDNLIYIGCSLNNISLFATFTYEPKPAVDFTLYLTD